jgi:hypothetical protein
LTAATSASILATAFTSALGFGPTSATGDQFYAKAGQIIELPERRADRPNREFLEWHLDEIFQA